MSPHDMTFAPQNPACHGGRIALVCGGSAHSRRRWMGLGWLVWIVVASSSVTSSASESDNLDSVRARAAGMKENRNDRPSKLFTILKAMRPRPEPGRPNYEVIGCSLGLSVELASLFENFSTVDDGRLRESPQTALTGHFLGKAVQQVPFLDGLRDRIPKGVKINVDLDVDRVVVEIKIPLPTLVW